MSHIRYKELRFYLTLSVAFALGLQVLWFILLLLIGLNTISIVWATYIGAIVVSNLFAYMYISTSYLVGRRRRIEDSVDHEALKHLQDVLDDEEMDIGREYGISSSLTLSLVLWLGQMYLSYN